MHNPIILSKNGLTKSAPVGYSFTSLIFGLFVPLLRGDWQMALGLFAMLLVSFVFPPLALLAWFLPPLYNRYFISRLIRDGWIADDADAGRIKALGLTETAIFPTQGDELKTIIVQVLASALLIGVAACGMVGIMAASGVMAAAGVMG